MGDIGFFFEYNGLVVQLPVNPEKLEVPVATSNKLTEIIKLGEINLLRDRKLTSISFSSFFPAATWFPAIRTTGRFEGPDFYKKFFTGIIADKKPVRFIVTGINIVDFLQTNKLVSIETFKITHQAGDHEDCYYDLGLKEYRSYNIQEVQLQTGAATPKAVSPNTPAIAPAKITVGCKVTVSGQLFRDSYGGGPGKILSAYAGKISIINTKGTHPYHIVSSTGGWLGWVASSSVKLI